MLAFRSPLPTVPEFHDSNGRELRFSRFCLCQQSELNCEFKTFRETRQFTL